MQWFARSTILALALCLTVSSSLSYAYAQTTVNLDPIPAGTVLRQGQTYSFYFCSSNGELLDSSFSNHYTLEVQLDTQEVREYTELFEVQLDEQGHPYLVVQLSDEETGPATLRYKTICTGIDGSRSSQWCSASLLLEPYDVTQEEIRLYSENDFVTRSYEDEEDQYLNFARGEVIFRYDLDEVTMDFGGYASFQVALKGQRRFNLYYSEELSHALRETLSASAAQAQVLDFPTRPTFDAEGTLTIHSTRPYLYEYRDGELVRLHSQYEDNKHTIQTQHLGCYVLLPDRI